MGLPPNVFLGTSSWTAPSWSGAFYPDGMPSAEYLAHYARRFRSVEVDATWYRSPSPRTVDGWDAKTPEGFRFAAKVPRTITHERLLSGCEAELEAFVEVMRRLGPKLGVLLLQFPYFRRDVLPDLPSFLGRLEPFLELLPEDVRFAVEIRNRSWLRPPLFDALRRRNVALAWIDHPWMPGAAAYGAMSGAATTDLLYVRWLGDRHGIEAMTQRWDTVVVDRSREIDGWARVLQTLSEKAERVHVYANNHYAGCGYQSAWDFEEAWERQQESAGVGAAAASGCLTG